MMHLALDIFLPPSLPLPCACCESGSLQIYDYVSVRESSTPPLVLFFTRLIPLSLPPSLSLSLSHTYARSSHTHIDTQALKIDSTFRSFFRWIFRLLVFGQSLLLLLFLPPFHLRYLTRKIILSVRTLFFFVFSVSFPLFHSFVLPPSLSTSRLVFIPFRPRQSRQLR